MLAANRADLPRSPARPNATRTTRRCQYVSRGSLAPGPLGVKSVDTDQKRDKRAGQEEPQSNPIRVLTPAVGPPRPVSVRQKSTNTDKVGQFCPLRGRLRLGANLTANRSAQREENFARFDSELARKLAGVKLGPQLVAQSGRWLPRQVLNSCSTPRTQSSDRRYCAPCSCQ